MTSTENRGSSNCSLGTKGQGINLSVLGLFGQTLPGFLRPSFPQALGECQHPQLAEGGGDLSGCAVPSEGRRDQDDSGPCAPRLPALAQPPRRGTVAGEAGLRALLTFFSAGTSSPRHLGAFSSLKNSYGSCCACMVPPGRLWAGRGAAAAGPGSRERVSSQRGTGPRPHRTARPPRGAARPG